MDLVAYFKELGPGPHSVPTPRGPIVIDNLTVTVDDTTGATVVDVQAAGFADPHVRIVNPPRNVPDPAGPVVVTIRPGVVQRFREDPLAALADLVAQHAGPRVPPRRAP